MDLKIGIVGFGARANLRQEAHRPGQGIRRRADLGCRGRVGGPSCPRLLRRPRRKAPVARGSTL